MQVMAALHSRPRPFHTPSEDDQDTPAANGETRANDSLCRQVLCVEARREDHRQPGSPAEHPIQPTDHWPPRRRNAVSPVDLNLDPHTEDGSTSIR